MRALSGGMKRRVLVAQALVHKPPVIVLDEPTAGVDVELRQGLWQFVRRLNRDGHTIVLTTHYLEEAEELCERIAMLKEGRVVALDTTRNLLDAARRCAERGAGAGRAADGTFGCATRLELRLRAASGGRIASWSWRRPRGRLRATDRLVRARDGFRTLLDKELLRFWKVGFQTVGGAGARPRCSTC